MSDTATSWALDLLRRAITEAEEENNPILRAHFGRDAWADIVGPHADAPKELVLYGIECRSDPYLNDDACLVQGTGCGRAYRRPEANDERRMALPKKPTMWSADAAVLGPGDTVASMPALPLPSLPPIPDISSILLEMVRALAPDPYKVTPQPERPKYAVDMLLNESASSRLCSRCKRPLRRGDVIVAEPINGSAAKLIICIECGRGPMLAAWDQYDALMRERRIAEEANEKRRDG